MADHSEKVKDIIEKELGVEREKLTNEASFIEDLGADSEQILSEQTPPQPARAASRAEHGHISAREPLAVSPSSRWVHRGR